MSSVSLEEYVDNLNHVRHRYAIYDHQFRERKNLEDDEIDSLAGIVRSLEAVRYGLPPAKDRRRAKSTLKPLETVVEGIRNETEQIIVSINNSFSSWLDNQGKLLEEKSEDDEIWTETLRGIDSYRRFSDTVLSAIGLKPRNDKIAAKLEEVALKKAELDGRLSLISAQYPTMNFASADSVEPVIKELDGIRKGYESAGFRRKLFPIPRKVEAYSFAPRYAQIDELVSDAQYVRDNFSFVASSRAGLERDTSRMKRIKSKALPLPENNFDPHTYDSLEPILYTRELVQQYRGLSYSINDLINERDARRYRKPQKIVVATNGAKQDDLSVRVITKEIPATNGHEQHYSAVQVIAKPETVQKAVEEIPYHLPEQDIFMPAPEVPRFNLFAYLQFSGPPPTETTWKVEQILTGKTDAKPWDERMRALGQTISSAQPPKPEEIEYFGAIREGLKESLRSGPLQELCGRLVSARSPIRMAMDALDTYLSQQRQNSLSFTTA